MSLWDKLFSNVYKVVVPFEINYYYGIILFNYYIRESVIKRVYHPELYREL